MKGLVGRLLIGALLFQIAVTVAFAQAATQTLNGRRNPLREYGKWIPLYLNMYPVSCSGASNPVVLTTRQLRIREVLTWKRSVCLAPQWASDSHPA
jgi:hypothetical protein